jgi:peptidoglycan hydrolase CwlO-like protein|tara:strand:+ start:834 stop:1022 length:189 start_codon:yes stop_codon:yes gene_type:complete
VSKEAEEIKKLQQTIDELQTELKFLQETVGVLVGAMMEEGDSEDFFGNSEAGNPSFRLNMGM